MIREGDWGRSTKTRKDELLFKANDNWKAK